MLALVITKRDFCLFIIRKYTEAGVVSLCNDIADERSTESHTG